MKALLVAMIVGLFAVANVASANDTTTAPAAGQHKVAKAKKKVKSTKKEEKKEEKKETTEGAAEAGAEAPPAEGTNP